MSPASVVIVSSPPSTTAFWFWRMLAFQRSVSRLVPSNSSSKLGPVGSPPPTSSPVRVKLSNAASGLPVPSLLKAKRPMVAFAGSTAGRPTGVHAFPSVE